MSKKDKIFLANIQHDKITIYRLKFKFPRLSLNSYMYGTEIPDNPEGYHKSSIDAHFSTLTPTVEEDFEYRSITTVQRVTKQTIFTQIKNWFIYMKGKFQGGSIKGSIFTLIMATIGTGILLIPNSIAASGLAWGLAQMVFCGWLGYYSLMTIVRCATIAKACSYQELADITYGQKFRWIINLVFFFGNWGTALLYLKLVSSLISAFIRIFFSGDNIPAWLVDPQSKVMPIIVATVFILPLSLAKELQQLRYLCLVSFFFVIFLCYVVVQEAFTYQPFDQASQAINQFTLGGFSTTFPTAVFSYMSHSNVLDVLGELKNPTQRRMRKVVLRTILIVFVTYAIVGSFGYITFANNMGVLDDVNKANGVILLAYGYDLAGNAQSFPIIAVLSILMMCIAIIVAEPLNVKPAKDGLKDLFFPRKSDEFGQPIQTNESLLAHFVLVFVTVYSAVLVAIFAQSVQTVMSVLGSSFFTLICFVFPSIFYIKLAQDEPLKGHKLMCWIMLITLSIFGLWNTYENIISL